MARTSMASPHRIEVSDLPSAANSGHDTTAESLTARTAFSSTSTVHSAGGGATASGSSAGGAASRRMMAWKWIAPPPLVFTYLHHPGPDEAKELPVAHPHDRCQLSGEVGPGPVPQRGRHGVPDHLGLVVEARGAQRRPDRRIALRVANRAADPYPMRADPGSVPGPAGQRLGALHSPDVHRPNDGAVNVAK